MLAKYMKPVEKSPTLELQDLCTNLASLGDKLIDKLIDL